MFKDLGDSKGPAPQKRKTGKLWDLSLSHFSEIPFTHFPTFAMFNPASFQASKAPKRQRKHLCQ